MADAAEASPPPSALSLGAGRIEAVDMARGVALVMMAVYHFSWDLSFFQLIATPVGTDPAWKWFARCIAGSFLFLAGVSLVLGHGDGIRWRPFGRRLAVVAGAAAAVTVATYFAFPDSYIFFGILHCIALSSVLALPFLRLPWPATLACAALALAMPHLVHGEAFDAPALVWLGLGSRVPVTNDWVPVFPWFGTVLAGIVAARLARPLIHRLASRRAGTAPARALAWAGRRSLVIYLVHQPVLLALLYPVAALIGPSPAAEAAPFLRECRETCASAGRGGETCRRACACTMNTLKRNDLWRRTLRNALTAEEAESAGALARRCFAESP
ncbi:MAG TPA: heparan-alpha-glucosaminide N-acetyltransferase [Beijerinckiaceae bacterium]